MLKNAPIPIHAKPPDIMSPYVVSDPELPSYEDIPTPNSPPPTAKVISDVIRKLIHHHFEIEGLT
jgi:hypothetical protein